MQFTYDLGYGSGSGLHTPKPLVGSKQNILSCHKFNPSNPLPCVIALSLRPQVLGKIFQSHGEQQDELLWSRFAEVWDAPVRCPPWPVLWL